VSAAVEEVRWRAETTSPPLGVQGAGAQTNGTNGAQTNGTNGTHANGTTDTDAASEAPTTETPVAGEPVADAPSLPPAEIEVTPEVPPKKKRWFRRNK
jgi:hypothetical protein